MSGRVLLYGATGYSGSEIAQRLVGHVDLVIAGRNAEALQELSTRLGVPWRSFEVADTAAATAALADADVLLNAAGPMPIQLCRSRMPVSMHGRTTSISAANGRFSPR